MKAENKVLKGQDAYMLYKSGKDEWNKWASEHEGWKVDFRAWDFNEESMVDFSEYVFPGMVDFTAVQFGEGNVSFSETQFGEGNVYFSEAQFGEGDVSFRNAQFGEGNVSFSEAQFGDGNVYFSEAQFGEGDVSFRNAQFGDGIAFFVGVRFGDGEVKFADTKFGGRVDFHETTFGTGRVNFYRTAFGDGYVNFSRVTFGEGDVNFHSADFGKGSVYFNNATFGKGTVNFTSAFFEKGDLLFQNVIVNGALSFLNTIFGSSVDSTVIPRFLGSTFSARVTLDSAQFSAVPDFRQISFNHDVSMEGTSVHYATVKRYRVFKVARSYNDASNYRKLRRIAMDAKDHDKELEFFSLEQRAKFHHHLNWIQYFPIFVYNLISDFGRSIWRPTIAWFAVIFLFAQLFLSLSTNNAGNYWNALAVSAGNSLPFISSSRALRERHIEPLYGWSPNIHWLVEVGSIVEGIISLILVFLIGLAIRNKLRL